MFKPEGMIDILRLAENRFDLMIKSKRLTKQRIQKENAAFISRHITISSPRQLL